MIDLSNTIFLVSQSFLYHTPLYSHFRLYPNFEPSLNSICTLYSPPVYCPSPDPVETYIAWPDLKTQIELIRGKRQGGATTHLGFFVSFALLCSVRTGVWRVFCFLSRPQSLSPVWLGLQVCTTMAGLKPWSSDLYFPFNWDYWCTPSCPASF
jgi:hypothetical protein